MPRLSVKKMACRHNDIRDCPLYHGMHVTGGPSCWSARMDEGECAVSLGANYDGLVEALRIKHPKLVAECEWNAAVRASKAQRERNLRLSGVH